LGHSIKKKTMKKGWHAELNENGWRCIQMHYTCDPIKAGEEWQEAAKEGTPHRVWQQEYEMNRTITSGIKVYEDFEKEIHVQDLAYDSTKPLYRGWDFGYHKPAVVFVQFDDQNTMLILDQLTPEKISTHRLAELVLEYTEKYFPDAGCIDFGDPAGNRKQSSAEDGKSDIEILADFKIYVTSKKSEVKGGIETVRELLRLRADGTPGLLMDRICSRVIGGFDGGYAYPEDQFGNPKSELPDKDGFYDHDQDAVRYIVINVVNPRNLIPVKHRKPKPLRNNEGFYQDHGTFPGDRPKKSKTKAPAGFIKVGNGYRRFI